jgi:hypothetical protein
MVFEIKANDPKASIEACSIIDYFKVKILEDQLGGPNDSFYSRFILDGDDKSLAILASIPNIDLDLI